MATSLTLNEALRDDLLDDFIAQAEAEGVAAANEAEFDRLMRGISSGDTPDRSGDTIVPGTQDRSGDTILITGG